MDTRTGQIYDNRELAQAAGVPDESLAEVAVTTATVTVTSGPFVGRVYERMADGRRGRRRRDLEGAESRLLRAYEAERTRPHGWHMESRAELEQQAKTNGFKFGLAQAVHHIWKRKTKETGA